MSIKIELVFDTIEEAADALSQLAAKFSSHTSFNTLDSARHIEHIDGASPAEAENDAALPVKRGRGRPPKIKPETDTPPEATQLEAAGEATPSEAPAPGNDNTEAELQNAIHTLTDAFKAGDAAAKENIRKWRDGLGLTRMGDLKAEHLPAALEFIAAMER